MGFFPQTLVNVNSTEECHTLGEVIKSQLVGKHTSVKVNGKDIKWPIDVELLHYMAIKSLQIDVFWIFSLFSKLIRE